MRMNRRSFLGSVIALAASPAVVRASSLMPVRGERWMPSAGLSVREVIAYHIGRDAYLCRLDTYNMASQYHVDFVMPPRSAGRVEYEVRRAMAMEVLEKHVKHHEGSTYGFIAPPTPPGLPDHKKLWGIA